MNKALIFKTVGIIMLIEAALMLLPFITAIIYGEKEWSYFLFTAAGIAVVGALLFFLIKPKKKNLYVADGFLITAIAWVVLSAVGAIPYCIDGLFPTYLDAFFETVSGFTTTGISILPDIEVLSRSMLLWRALTNWIGGMGVLVFLLALAPVAGGTSIYLYRAESPGPFTEKFTSKLSTGAKYLYYIYIALTLAEIIALCISGLTVFQSVVVTFGTVATGGFTYLNASLATMTLAQHIIVEIFMVLSGMSFGVFFLLVTGRFKKALKSTEIKVYLIIIVIAAAMITYNVFTAGSFSTISESIHHSLFGTISAITSTGFASTNMNLWPWFSKGLLIFLMFVGGCSGSTAGGIKVSRFIILVKSLWNYLRELVHPRSVSEVKFNGKKVDSQMVRSTFVYFSLIMIITTVSMIIVSQDPEMDFSTSFASVATTLNNNGIEFKGVSVGGYITFQWYTKIVYIFDMLIGRLEIFPILILLTTITSPVDKLVRHIRKKVRT